MKSRNEWLHEWLHERCCPVSDGKAQSIPRIVLVIEASWRIVFIRGVSWSLPFFPMKKTLNSWGNLKFFLFMVLAIGFYTFCPSFSQVMDTILKKICFSRQTIRRAIFRLLQNWRNAALQVSVPSMQKGVSRTGRSLESTAGAIIFPN